MGVTLYAYQGKDFTESAIFLNAQGLPINVLNHTSYIKVAKYYEAPQASVITINGAAVTPTTLGIFEYAASKETILLLKHGSNVYTRYLLDEQNEVINVVSGEFIVIPSVL